MFVFAGWNLCNTIVAHMFWPGGISMKMILQYNSLERAEQRVVTMTALDRTMFDVQTAQLERLVARDH